MSKKRLYVLVWLGIVVLITNILLGVLFQTNFERWLNLLFVIIILSYILDIAVIKIVGFNIFSIIVFFITFSYLFHFGQVIVNVLEPNYKFIAYNYIRNVNEDIVRSSLTFCYNVIQMVVYGICCTSNKMRTKLKSRKKYCFMNLNSFQFKLMAWLFFILFGSMRIIYNLHAIKNVLLKRYTGLEGADFSGVYIQFSNFCVVGFIMLILAYSRQKRKARLIFVFEVLFMMWGMLTGGRIYSTISIVLICYCYFKAVERIKIKNAIVVICAGCLLLQVITAITTLRTTSNFNVESISQKIISTDNNFLLQMLDEFGGSVYTVEETIVEIPNTIQYHKGLSYIKAWLLVGVNMREGLLDETLNEVEYTRILQKQNSYGGSFIGELYYNFGYWGIVFAWWVGVLAQKISCMCDRYLYERRYIEYSLLIMPAYALLSWVRGYFDGFTRSTIWAALIIIIAYESFSKISSRSAIYEGE